MATVRAPLLSLLLALLAPGPSLQQRKGHLMPLGHSGPNHPIEESAGFVPPAVFVERYLRAERPVVMRGAVKESAAFRKWTDAYLRSQAPPGLRITAHNVNFNGSGVRTETLRFVDLLERRKTSRVYVAALMPAFLEPDLALPFSLQCSALNASLDAVHFSIVDGNTATRLHVDPRPNFNCMFRGAKRLLFVNTTQYAAARARILDVEEEDSSYSSVDPDRVDLDRHSVFAGMDFHVAELAAGDCLFQPADWLHFVRWTGVNVATVIWMDEPPPGAAATCRATEDRDLTLDKVNFAQNRAAAAEAERQDAAVREVADSAAAALLSEMTAAGPLTRAEAERFLGALRAIDANGNGRVDAADFEL